MSVAVLAVVLLMTGGSAAAQARPTVDITSECENDRTTIHIDFTNNSDQVEVYEASVAWMDLGLAEVSPGQTGRLSKAGLADDSWYVNVRQPGVGMIQGTRTVVADCEPKTDISARPVCRDDGGAITIPIHNLDDETAYFLAYMVGDEFAVSIDAGQRDRLDTRNLVADGTYNVVVYRYLDATSEVVLDTEVTLDCRPRTTAGLLDSCVDNDGLIDVFVTNEADVDVYYLALFPGNERAATVAPGQTWTFPIVDLPDREIPVSVTRSDSAGTLTVLAETVTIACDPPPEFTLSVTCTAGATGDLIITLNNTTATAADYRVFVFGEARFRSTLQPGESTSFVAPDLGEGRERVLILRDRSVVTFETVNIACTPR